MSNFDMCVMDLDFTAHCIALTGLHLTNSGDQL